MFIRKMIEKRKEVEKVESLNDVMEFEDDIQGASDSSREKLSFIVDQYDGLKKK